MLKVEVTPLQGNKKHTSGCLIKEDEICSIITVS